MLSSSILPLHVQMPGISKLETGKPCSAARRGQTYGVPNMNGPTDVGMFSMEPSIFLVWNQSF